MQAVGSDFAHGRWRGTRNSRVHRDKVQHIELRPQKEPKSTKPIYQYRCRESISRRGIISPTTYLDPRNTHQSEEFLAFVVVFFRYFDLTTRQLVDILGRTYPIVRTCQYEELKAKEGRERERQKGKRGRGKEWEDLPTSFASSSSSFAS